MEILVVMVANHILSVQPSMEILVVMVAKLTLSVQPSMEILWWLSFEEYSYELFDATFKTERWMSP